MGNLSIRQALSACERALKDGKYAVPTNGFLTPSFIVTISAYIQKRQLSEDTFIFPKKEHFRYLTYIDFFSLWNKNPEVNRVNTGKNYSLLTLLENEEVTNQANSQIVSCIKHLTDNANSDGIDLLQEVVGELHDNVWSHGISTGFSMAQKNQDVLEFALADCGLGFLRELQRVGLSDIDTHQEAIEWCIQKGNSSKKISAEKEDDWCQVLPSDCIGNPMGASAKYKKENNHAGLGLAKLIDLVKKYNGELQIVSGDVILELKEQNIYFRDIPFWQGVIIRCKFKISKLKSIISNDNQEELDDILNALTE